MEDNGFDYITCDHCGMKFLHVGGGYRYDPQSMGKVKDNILELYSRRCRSQALSLSPLSTSAKLSHHVNIYYTTPCRLP
jgi:hypothetical protein